MFNILNARCVDSAFKVVEGDCEEVEFLASLSELRFYIDDGGTAKLNTNSNVLSLSQSHNV